MINSLAHAFKFISLIHRTSFTFFNLIVPQKDWSQQIVPDNWLDATERTPITTVEWMREAEQKHGRISMLAVLGWVVTDAGIRMPGSGYESITSNLAAHDASVANGSMG